jgi:hypothetical protein
MSGILLNTGKTLVFLPFLSSYNYMPRSSPTSGYNLTGFSLWFDTYVCFIFRIEETKKSVDTLEKQVYLIGKTTIPPFRPLVKEGYNNEQSSYAVSLWRGLLPKVQPPSGRLGARLRPGGGRWYQHFPALVHVGSHRNGAGGF